MSSIRVILRCLPVTFSLLFIPVFAPGKGALPDNLSNIISRNTEAQNLDATATPRQDLLVEFATVVGQASINVRDEGSRTGSIIGVFNPGERAQVMGRSAAGNWLNIRLPDGGEGWVSAALVQTESRTRSPDIETALAGVSSNAEWLPLVQEFDGVAMVLVPAGCFMMGSDDGSDDEQPAHEVCIEEPFWIDRYEVSNAQFNRFGGHAEKGSNRTYPDFPREQIGWHEAQAFCALRGARLPTEAEWEFAARGPDALIYPWGNLFESDNVAYGENSGGETAPVASRPGGVSWIGAYHMSGNVWEWTSSLYRPYPYDSGDGREQATVTTGDTRRVLRGGSVHYGAGGLRASVREALYPSTTTGFRCARSYQ